MFALLQYRDHRKKLIRVERSKQAPIGLDGHRKVFLSSWNAFKLLPITQAPPLHVLFWRSISCRARRTVAPRESYWLSPSPPPTATAFFPCCCLASLPIPCHATKLPFRFSNSEHRPIRGGRGTVPTRTRASGSPFRPPPPRSRRLKCSYA